MSGGSQQLRRYRIARRGGATLANACAASGISSGEAKLIDAEDAKHPPSADAYRPLGAAFCASCGNELCGCSDSAWRGMAA